MHGVAFPYRRNPDKVLMNTPKTRKKRQNAQPEHLGQAIRSRRKALKKTLDVVARDTGLTTGFISQVERGKLPFFAVIHGHRQSATNQC